MVVKITDEQANIYSKAGFNDDSLQQTVNAYRNEGLDDNEIQAKLDAQALKLTSQTKSQEAPEKEPVNQISDILKGGLSGLSEIPRGAANISNEYLRPLIGKEPLSEEELQQGLEKVGAGEYQPKTLSGGISKTVASIAPYLTMPQSTLPEIAATGGLAGLTQAANEGKNPLIGGIIGATTGVGLHGAEKGLEALQLQKIPGRVANMIAGIPEEVAQRAVSPASETLDLINAPDIPIAVQDAYDRLLAKMQTGAKGLKQTAGKAVSKAKQEGIAASKSIMGVPSKFNVEKYSNTIEDVLSNKPKNAKISTKERELKRHVQDFIQSKKYLEPEEIQKQIELLDTDFINWEKGIGASKNLSEKRAIEAARKVRGLLSKDLKEIYPESYSKANKGYEELMNVLQKEENPRLIDEQGKSQPIINILRSIEKPAAGQTRKAFEEIGEKIGVPVTEKVRDILAAEKITGAFDKYQKSQPDLGKIIQTAAMPMIKKGMAFEKARLKQLQNPQSVLSQASRMAQPALQTAGNIAKLIGAKGMSYLAPDGKINSQNYRQERGIK
jgi:hypothetical protein